MDLWRSVFSQWIVTDHKGHAVGIVGLYNHMPAVSAAHLFAVGAADAGIQVSEGAGLLLQWGFEQLDLDKVWIETPEFNLAQFRSIESIADVEGRLHDFDFWQGRFWDLFILSVKRQTWTTSRQGQILKSRTEPVCPENETLRRSHHQELISLFSEGWPLDSLGRVEALTILEEASGHILDGTVLEGVSDLDPDTAADRLIDLVSTGD